MALTLPRPVIFTRALVPLWVFNFGMRLSLSFRSQADPLTAVHTTSRPRPSRGRSLQPSWRRATSRTDYGIRTDLLRCDVGTQDHVHVHARDHRGGVDDGQFVDVGGDAVEDALPQLGVGAFATAEHDGHLDLVPTLEEPANVVYFGLVVVVVNLHAEHARLHLLLAGALAGLVG